MAKKVSKEKKRLIGQKSKIIYELTRVMKSTFSKSQNIKYQQSLLSFSFGLNFNSQRAATPVFGRYVFDSFFRPLPLFKIFRPKKFIIFKFDFLTDGELRIFLWFVWVLS